MDLGLEGKVALVGGASKGLGKAIARELIAEGCAVGICARGKADLESTEHELAAIGGNQKPPRVWSFVADVSDPASARSLVEDAIARRGRVDILVNNAGGPPPGPSQAFDDAAWEQAFRLSLLSAVAMTRAAVPGMVERGWGRVINITSVSVKQPLDNLVLSNSMRLGVVGWAKSLSRELAPCGITVNNVGPGYTRTERLVSLARTLAAANDSTEAEVFADWEAQIPMQRVGSPEDIGGVVAFLASDRASYITGVTLQVDGGFVRGIG